MPGIRSRPVSIRTLATRLPDFSALDQNVEIAFLKLEILVHAARRYVISDLDLDLDRQFGHLREQLSQGYDSGVVAEPERPLVTDGIELSSVAHADPAQAIS